jgi:hypothetical protein
VDPRIVCVPEGGSFSDGVNEALRKGPLPEDARLAFIDANSWSRRHEQIVRVAFGLTMAGGAQDGRTNRSVTVSTFAPHGQVRFYRKEGGVSDEMARHVRWHAVTRELLGLPPAPPPPLPDYISALNTWDRDLVIAALRQIEEATGRPWLTAVGRNVHFSEFILYGVFVDEIARPDASAVTDDPLCQFYWDTVPLTVDAGVKRLGSIKPADVAVMISAKSNTPVPVRRAVLAKLTTP